jgi:hypothetical protein
MVLTIIKRALLSMEVMVLSVVDALWPAGYGIGYGGQQA